MRCRRAVFLSQINISYVCCLSKYRSDLLVVIFDILMGISIFFKTNLVTRIHKIYELNELKIFVIDSKTAMKTQNFITPVARYIAFLVTASKRTTICSEGKTDVPNIFKLLKFLSDISTRVSSVLGHQRKLIQRKLIMN